MRILFLSHRVPYPLDKGDRIRSYNIIKYLSKFHSISLMSISHEAIHPKSREALRDYCESLEFFKINPLFGKIKSCFHLFAQSPLTLPAFYSRAFRDSVTSKLRDGRFDLVYIYSSSMAQYVLGAKNIPKLMDFIDVDSEKWLNYAARASQPMKSIYSTEGVRLRSFEKEVASICDQNIFAAEREARLFQRIAPTASCAVVQNGVDLVSSARASCRENKLVFVGAMDYYPNIDAMRYFSHEILPLVRKSVPEAALCIVGRNPTRAIKELSRVNNVIVTGCVDQIAPYLRDATVSVAPLRIARGIQNKVLEAMAHGVPLVTTTAALEGIEAMPGRDVLVADEPTAFAEKIVAVLRDLNLRSNLSKNALALVRQKYSWDTRLKILEESIAQVVS